MPKRDIHLFSRRLDLIESGLAKMKLPDKELSTILQFRDQCLADGLSLARTVKYLASIRAVYVRASYHILGARPSQIVALLAVLERSELAAWTKHDYKLALRKYLIFAGKEKLAAPVRLAPVHVRKLPDELLTCEEIVQLIDAARTVEDRAFLILLYESGCRIGELLTLQRKRVQFDAQGCVAFVEGKTGMRRLRLIEAAPTLDEWISYRSCKPEDYIFPGTYKTYTKRLAVTARRAGIEKRIYPHLFRHSRATFLASYLTEFQLKTFLGWSPGSNMAAIYVHLAGADLDAALSQVPTLHSVVQQQCAIRAGPLRV